MTPDPAWDQLMRDLTRERFGKPVPEWHNRRPVEADPRALRLIHDNHDERRSA